MTGEPEEDRRNKDDRSWRDPRDVLVLRPDSGAIQRDAFGCRVTGRFWELLEELQVTLLVTREYEHALLAMTATGGTPHVTALGLPHPSGVAVDRSRDRVHVACTRNPNQILEMRPCRGALVRDDAAAPALEDAPLMPYRTTFYTGCSYLHDLALIDGELHGNAVGHNAVVRLESDGGSEIVWWPRSIDAPEGALFGRNHIQLNSIAAGRDLASSYFSASSATVLRQRPGDADFPVDGTGVLFAGDTREPVCEGLTRPHSARLHRERIWLGNSGYGELGIVENGRLDVVARLPGWTRGLCFAGGYAFVGTSRVIPRFIQYAPGLEAHACVCSVQAVNTDDGKVAASIEWPQGNQIFAVDWISSGVTRGLPFRAKTELTSAELRSDLFYSYRS